MNIANLRTELENDLAWRQDEIRFFQNQSVRLDSPDQGNQFRRAIVVMLYSHFEGYCKFALNVYIDAINGLGMLCREVNPALAAASLCDVLGALRHSTSKCVEFRNALPDDNALHIFAREREFIEKISHFESRVVKIPDGAVDMESNLKPVVLRKNLYKLGLPLDTFEAVEGQINRLIKCRNDIAHGASKSGLPLKSYEEFRNAVFNVMQTITIEITKAVAEEKFRRPAAGMGLTSYSICGLRHD